MEVIVGAVVSLLVQWLKSKWSQNEWQTLGIVLALSLVSAGIYTYFVQAGYGTVLATVLVTAGAFYTYVVQRFEK